MRRVKKARWTSVWQVFCACGFFWEGCSSSVVAFARHYLQNAIVHQTKIIYKAGALKVNYSLRVV